MLQEISRYNLDGSQRAEEMVEAHFKGSWTDMLGQLQLSFVVFLILSVSLLLRITSHEFRLQRVQEKEVSVRITFLCKNSILFQKCRKVLLFLYCYAIAIYSNLQNFAHLLAFFLPF